jgi:hypothetical protein
MTAVKPSRPFAAWVLIGLLIFLSFGALVCGALFMLAPDGSLLQMPLSNLKGSPFSSFLIPGMVLFVFLGVYPLCLVYGLWKRPTWRWPDAVNPFKPMHWSWTGALAAGAVVLIWLGVELIWVEYMFLHTVYFVWSGLVLVLALLPGVRRYYRR